MSLMHRNTQNMTQWNLIWYNKGQSILRLRIYSKMQHRNISFQKHDFLIFQFFPKFKEQIYIYIIYN